jgi:hypothetical protein
MAHGGQTFDLSHVGSLTDQSNGVGTYGASYIFQNTLTGGLNTTRIFTSDPGVTGQYIGRLNGNTYYVRCTQNSGTSLNVGDTVGSWLSIDDTTSREFGISYSAGAGFDQVTANIDLEIARDSGGTDIVATVAGLVITAGNTG